MGCRMCHGALASAAAAAAGRNRDGMGVWMGAEKEREKYGAQKELLGRGQGQRVEGSNFAVPLGSGSVKNFRSAISAHRGSAAADADSKPGAAHRRTVRRRSPHGPNRSAAARATVRRPQCCACDQRSVRPRAPARLSNCIGGRADDALWRQRWCGSAQRGRTDAAQTDRVCRDDPVALEAKRAHGAAAQLVRPL